MARPTQKSEPSTVGKLTVLRQSADGKLVVQYLSLDALAKYGINNPDISQGVGQFNSYLRGFVYPDQLNPSGRTPKGDKKETFTILFLPGETAPLKNKEDIDPIDALAVKFDIDIDLRESFEAAITQRIESFKAENVVLSVPETPLRDYEARESIIDYLRSPEGFGPWLEAGALTRPLLRQKSTKAYTALSNWLKTNDLPADLPIPTKKELTDKALSQLGSTSTIAKLGQAAASRLRRLR